jgi:hypothetical protein
MHESEFEYGKVVVLIDGPSSKRPPIKFKGRSCRIGLDLHRRVFSNVDEDG